MSRYADMVWCQLRFPAELEAELAVAWQTILHDVEHASYVVLPVVG